MSQLDNFVILVYPVTSAYPVTPAYPVIPAQAGIHQPQNGSTLIPVLLLIQVLFLLSWSAVENAFIQRKNVQIFLRQNQLFQISEEVLRKIETDLQTQVKCIIPIIPLKELAEKHTNLWPCQRMNSDFNFFYAVESLGKNPCIEVEGEADQIAHILRITLLSTTQKENIKIILQSTIIKPDNRSSLCPEVPQKLKAGRQSWYQFN